MRRSTVGVTTAFGAHDANDTRMARADRHDPERVRRLLEPLVNETRRARLLGVIERRLESVTVVLDSPYDPHNGAAVLRSCEAFGLQRLHVVQRPGVPFAVARSVTRGADKWVEVVCHCTPATALSRVLAEDMTLVAAHPDGELSPEALRTVPRLALVLGNEREGIGPELSRACTVRVSVPMRGFVESLNVSVTAAILLHAATRGRAGDLPAAVRLRLYARGLYFSVPRAPDILGER